MLYEPGATRSLDTASERGTAVVIEDDPLLRIGMVDWLEDLGFRAGAASNGFSGLRRVRSELPNVVVLDLSMPDLSGQDVLAAVRDDPATARTPVLVVTSRPDWLAEVGPRERLLAKPFTYDAFVREVEALAAA